MIRHNLIAENNNLTVPVNGSTAIAPWGAGVELPGDYADLVEGNVIVGNPNDGVLGFEYANPFTPENGFEGTIFFMLAGNRVSSNVFARNGSGLAPSRATSRSSGGFSEMELFQLLGYPESHSVNNCVSANRAARTGPSRRTIEGTWGCQNSTTPSPAGACRRSNTWSGCSSKRTRSGSAAARWGSRLPPPQPTMPNPCAGVPKNALCP